MFKYSDDPNYDLGFTAQDCKVYFIKDDYLASTLHVSRKVEADIQNMYSVAGVTADYLRKMCDEALKMLENDPKGETLRQNMIAIFNQIRYRTITPVDSLCLLRMGCIFAFLEMDNGTTEPVDSQIAWTDTKMRIAQSSPEAYDFFFALGYRQYTLILQSLRYFEESGLFQPAGGDDNVLYPLRKRIDDVYESIGQSCLLRAEGDQTKADALYNCSYFEYYYRIEQYNKWAAAQKKELESLKGR